MVRTILFTILGLYRIVVAENWGPILESHGAK